ncbi:MAG: DNA-primase RepB domain-containing protein [Candidatus Thiodiazotropha sp.]
MKRLFTRDPNTSHIACWIDLQGRELQADRDESERFLMRLDPRASYFSFRTFSDTGYTRVRTGDPLQREVHGTLDACWHRLVALNRQGAVIAVTINHGNGRGRRSADIRRVRALFLDDDRGTDPGRFPLKPHIRVETSAGHNHFYWLVEGLPLQQFASCQQRLAERYQGDTRVQALNQAMQLPGFWRRKRITHPRLPRVSEIGNHNPFRIFELDDLFEPQRDANHRQ